MNNIEMSTEEMVDRGYVLSKQIKALEEELKVLKSHFLDEYAETGKQEWMGQGGKCKITARVSTEINVRQLHKLLKTMKQEPSFFALVKASVTDTRKLLDDGQFALVSTTSTGSPSVSFV